MFYENVSSLCKQRGIKITTLSRTLGLSSSAPSYWRSGSVPKASTLQKIAEYFDVSTDYLLYGDTKEAGNSISNISNSTIAQGVSGNHISISNGASPKSESSEVSEAAAELIRIFKQLDLRGQNNVLHTAYIEEERMSKGGQSAQ